MEENTRITLEVPSEWEDVTVNQFQAIQSLDRTAYHSDLSYMVEILSILTDTPADILHRVSLENMGDVMGTMSWLHDPLSQERSGALIIDGETYKIKGSLNSLTVGEVVSIEQMIDIEELSYTSAMDVVLAILLRKVGPDGKLAEFDAENFADLREKAGKLKITDVYGDIVFFSTGESKSTNFTEVILTVAPKRKRTKKKCPKRTWSLRRILERIIGYLRGGSGTRS